jgi:hypothetical protein
MSESFKHIWINFICAMGFAAPALMVAFTTLIYKAWIDAKPEKNLDLDEELIERINYHYPRLQHYARPHVSKRAAQLATCSFVVGIALFSLSFLTLLLLYPK